MHSRVFSGGTLHRLSRSLWLALAGFLLFAAAFVVYVRTEKQIDHANERRQHLLALSDEVHQSSDDLTRMARSYVITGNPDYKRHYQEILDIRDGRRPRPANYGMLFWSLLPPGTELPNDPGAAQPLLELLGQGGFTDSEMALLAQAKARSDDLAVIEHRAFSVLESNPQARDQAIALLHDATYHRAKIEILQPIETLLRDVDRRSLDAVHDAESTAAWMRIAFLVFGLLLIVLLWRIQRALHAVLGAPVDQLHARIQRLGRGDFSDPITVPRGLGDSVLGWLAETQANLARIDTQRREAENTAQRIAQLYAALSQCSQAISRCSTTDELYSHICRDLVRFGNMKMAWIGNINENSAEVVPLASFGSGAESLKPIALDPEPDKTSAPPADALLLNALRSNQPCWCNDIFADSASSELHATARRFGWHALALLPLHSDDTVTGALVVYSEKAHAFDDEARRLLVSMALEIDFATKSFEREAQRVQAEERIRLLAHYDALTGLPNRITLREHGEYAIRLARRTNSPLAVMFLDLDHFKEINDTLGHNIGDGLLIGLATRVRQLLRGDDMVSRMGGDEFVFLLHGADRQGASHVARKVLDAITLPFTVEGHDLNVGGSMGIALYPGDGGDLDTLSKNADIAMYRVKQTGRNGMHFYADDSKH